ncbi:hypothetical protein BKH46_01610 [Helicobacter sp. 12S02634-8]|uniref:LPP20 family lipoprotein n=1 Tax=Helicobacter sp. 12S02634-8 TaxID=1476199 RepID=UPI000BA69769|nr:LPP20 family lipoprotein [Helicobacter sp. 12S02634-8]PAF48033.1 hypothetical protein BKH46_01610 [Helicobacter sp. 12S02634-8]
MLSGCMLTPSAPPEWFLSIPKDTTSLYGNGIGGTLEISKQNAINDLASSIQVTIYSDTTLTQTQTDKTQSSELSQNIWLSLDTTELQNITLTHSDYKNSLYYTQVKIAKAPLSQSLQSKYHTLYTHLSPLKDTHCPFLSIKEKATLQRDLKELQALKHTIDTLTPNIPLPHLSPYENLLIKNTPLPKARLVFSGNGDTETINILRAEYAKFIQNTPSQDAPIIKNHITTRTHKENTEISLQVTMYDCLGNAIFHAQITASLNNKADTLTRLKAQLYKQLLAYSQDP